MARLQREIEASWSCSRHGSKWCVPDRKFPAEKKAVVLGALPEERPFPVTIMTESQRYFKFSEQRYHTSKAEMHTDKGDTKIIISSKTKKYLLQLFSSYIA